MLKIFQGRDSFMIIYIHGFGSSGQGFKIGEIKQWFGAENILSPSLSYVPELAIDTLIQIIELLTKHHEPVQLIGSSLGGYYALYLAERYGLKAVLINPAIYPYRELRQALGQTKNYYDESSFLCTEKHLSMLKQFEVNEITQQENFLVLLQQYDEILDYRDALNKLPRATCVINQDGDHGYANITSKKQEILNFFNS